MTNSAKMNILGVSGLKQFDGYVLEEFLPELRGPRAVRLYREMQDNDSTINAVFYTIKNLARHAPRKIEEAPGGAFEADFVEGCMNDMSHPFDDLISEIMSMLTYGWSYHEKVFKIRGGPDTRNPRFRSRFNDRRIGWRKFALRSQDSVLRWEFDDDGGLRGMWQLAPPRYKLTFLPIEKALLFRTELFKANPEGRALPLDTPIPVPSGWTTIGQLSVGDMVFDDKGKIRYVTAKSKIFTKRPIYRITFTNGDDIEADENHQWSVTTSNDRHLGSSERIVTTKELFDHLQTTNPNYCCGSAPILDCPDLELPCDPYILGYWLGDGYTNRGGISVCEQDYPHLAKELTRAGYAHNFDASKFRCGVPGLMADLKAAGVFGDKHIPTRYLRASKAQRLALLQGMMDSDGHTSSANSHARGSIFSNSDLTLLGDFQELVRTLGGRPILRLHTKAGELGGIIHGHQIVQRKDGYYVRFGLDEMFHHRLPRKAEREYERIRNRHRGHYIESVEFIGSADTVCIEVDSPSHLFLAGESMVPTHNSLLRGVVIPYFYKKRIQETEAIGVARDMTGLVTMEVPEEMLSSEAPPGTKALRADLERMLSSIHRDQREFAMIPPEIGPDGAPTGFKLKLLSSGGKRQNSTGDIITRYSKEMAMAMMSELVFMGNDKAGSYALSKTKSNMMGMAISTLLTQIANVFNQFAIPELLSINGMDIAKAPKLVFGKVFAPEPEEIASYIAKLAAVKTIETGKELSDRLLEIGDFPKSVTPMDEALLPGLKIEAAGAQQGAKNNGEQDLIDGGNDNG